MTSLCTLNFVAHVINRSDSVVLRMYPWRSWRTVNEPSYTNQQSPTILVPLMHVFSTHLRHYVSD